MQRKGRYVYALPTINQAKKVCWQRLCDMLKPLMSEVVAIKKSELAFYFKNGSILTLESGEKRERIEGISITGAIIDECSDQLPGLFTLSIFPALSRVPNSWCWQVGVPKSNGVGGQEFKERCEKYQALSEYDDKYAHIHWTYADKEFREILRQNLDEKGFREHALGEWASYAGGCYYAFADDNILTEEYKIDHSLPILFGFDFNVDWYSIVVAQYKNDMFFVFDEIRLANSNTRAALDVLVAKYGSMARQFIAYGDAASRQRQTSADISDYLIIEAEKRIPMKVVFPRSNPSVVYRIERVNSFLKTADNTIRLMVAPHCRYLIKDLYSVTWKEGERTQDKKNLELTHMSDALGYLLVSHEEHYGQHKVILMNLEDGRRIVRCEQQMADGSRGGKTFAGQLIKPKAMILMHGVR
jgi:hypothetical protein